LESIASVVTITETNLSGSSVECPTGIGGNSVCLVPGTYPDGAVKYQLDYDPLVSDEYFLWGYVDAKPLTDETGTELSALPTVGATFCDPNSGSVFRPITPTPATGADNYNAHWTWDCSAAEIAASRSYHIKTTALMTEQMTGNAIVPSVLRVRTPANSLQPAMDRILGLRDGKVWEGNFALAGTPHFNSTLYNKAALNADLTARGWAVLP
jgi:hypothetical protein